MAQYGFLGPLRNSLRGRFFNFLDQALQTDDGRRIITKVMKGLTTDVGPVFWFKPQLSMSDRTLI